MTNGGLGQAQMGQEKDSRPPGKTISEIWDGDARTMSVDLTNSIADEMEEGELDKDDSKEMDELLCGKDKKVRFIFYF